MKKVLLLISIFIATAAFAATTKDISKTVHNMGSTGTGAHFVGTIDQVCIYCHTPHNAKQSALLWNKNSLADPASFKLYSSQSFSKNRYNSIGLTATSPSLLCLSCHDGKTAINIVHSSKLGTDQYDNVGQGTIPTTINTPGSFGPPFDDVSPANLGSTAGDMYAGTNLTDDHPIAFSYTQVQTDQGSGQLHATPLSDAWGNTVRFFGAQKVVECSTCHDPHVNYDSTKGGNAELRPFLVMSNKGSGLCLACHNK